MDGVQVHESSDARGREQHIALDQRILGAHPRAPPGQIQFGGDPGVGASPHTSRPSPPQLDGRVSPLPCSPTNPIPYPTLSFAHS